MKIALYKINETKDGQFLEKIWVDQVDPLTSKSWVVFDPFEKMHIGSNKPEDIKIKYFELQAKLDNTKNKSSIILEPIEPIEPRESITQTKDDCLFEKI